MRIRFTEQAYRDIEAIYRYIAEHDPIAAQKTLDRIKSIIDQLPSHPELGRPGRVEETRELIVPSTPFIVAYQLSVRFIDILAIIHTSKRWPDSF